MILGASGAMALAALAAASGATRAQAATPIQHVVVIYLENHSFDNVLGYWCDQHPGRCPDGGMPSRVTLSDGAVVRPTLDPDTVPNVQHDEQAQVAAMHIVGGVPQMNGWQNIPGAPGDQLGCDAAAHYKCISGYQPSQIPNLTTLAGSFAISDKTFSMADSPSWGGHLYAAMASVDGFVGNNPMAKPGVAAGPGWGCDSDKITPWITPAGRQERIPSCIPDYNLGLPNGGAFEPTPAAYHASIFDRLDSAGLSWRIYGDAASSHPGDGYDWSICPSLAECLYTSQRQHLVDAGTFITDAKSELPAFSIVAAGGLHGLVGDSCHNKFSMTACDNYIGQLVSAVENGPDWRSTAIFITFDDCGCFYDQVPPPLAPDGTREGPRVPLIIVSPYAKPGYTDTAGTSFTGILAYTEQTFHLAPLGVNDAHAYAFTSAFNYSQAPLKPVRMALRPLPATAKRIHLTPALENDLS